MSICWVDVWRTGLGYMTSLEEDQSSANHPNDSWELFYGEIPLLCTLKGKKERKRIRDARHEWHITASDNSLCQLEQTEAHYGSPFRMSHKGRHGGDGGYSEGDFFLVKKRFADRGILSGSITTISCVWVVQVNKEGRLVGRRTNFGILLNHLLILYNVDIVLHYTHLVS